jgi:hypothetical protein
MDQDVIAYFRFRHASEIDIFDNAGKADSPAARYGIFILNAEYFPRNR